MKIQKYRRGQIWWYSTEPTFDGHTYNKGKPRPIILVSNDLANEYSNTLIGVPCTTQDKKDMPTHTEFEMNGNNNTALAECLMSINVDKLSGYIGTVDAELMEKIEGTIMIALGLHNAIKERCVKKDNIINENMDTVIIEKDSDMISTTKKKRGRKSRYSLQYKKKFVSDYETYGRDYMMEHYKLKTKRALNDNIYVFRKYIKEHTK